jgi:hypothetical protein
MLDEIFSNAEEIDVEFEIGDNTSLNITFFPNGRITGIPYKVSLYGCLAHLLIINPDINTKSLASYLRMLAAEIEGQT